MKSEHATRPPTKGESWQWCEGRVNTKQDHFEIHYGNAFGDLIPVAIVGRIRQGLVNVHFLIDKADLQNSKIVQDVAGELTFYLAELNEPDPWHYLQYHCGTASNVYSAVYWSLMRGSAPNLQAPATVLEVCWNFPD